jgi:hypothetical protein
VHISSILTIIDEGLRKLRKGAVAVAKSLPTRLRSISLGCRPASGKRVLMPQPQSLWMTMTIIRQAPFTIFVMSKVRVAAFSISIDGFGAGPRQDLENPLGVRGMELHRWFFGTEAFNKMHGESGGTRGTDNDIAAESFENLGAWILGRNMFGPVRGPWKDDFWKGWWGPSPRTTLLCSSLLIMRALRWRWKAAPRFTSSQMGLRPH